MRQSFAFMTKDLSKVIINRSRMKNKYTKQKSGWNSLALKRTKQIFTDLTKKLQRKSPRKASEKNESTKKDLWKSVSPSFTNENVLSDLITLDEGGKII